MTYDAIREQFVTESLRQLKNVGGIIIHTCRLSDVQFLVRFSAGQTGLSWGNPPEAVWFLAYSEGELVGVCSLVVKGGIARLKSAFVPKEHRGKGIYKKLFKERMEYVYDECCTQATCFSTMDSRPLLLANKFKVVSGEGKDIVFMRRVL